MRIKIRILLTALVIKTPVNKNIEKKKNPEDQKFCKIKILQNKKTLMEKKIH